MVAATASLPEMSSVESITTPLAAVHLSYDTNTPPSHPGPQWTRFVCLSDTHSNCFTVPSGDVLLHTGDISSYGRVQQLKVTMDWINKLPHPIKIIIGGNHDLSLDSEWYEGRWIQFHRHKEDVEAAKCLMIGDEARRSGVIYLEYSSVEIQVKQGGRKWKVYGCPGSPWFGGWAFNYERGDEAQMIHQRTPYDTDILLTHGPPEDVLDVVHDGTHVGCKELMEQLKRVRPALHVFGHIHEDRGVKMHRWTSSNPQSHVLPGRHTTIFVNAANIPSGRKASEVKRQGIKPVVGGPGFQPVIVDLFDPVASSET